MQNNHMYYRYNRPYFMNNMYNPAFANPSFKPKTKENEYVEDISKTNITKDDSINLNENDTIFNESTTQEADKTSKNESKMHRLGPIEYNSERLSLFGFSIAIDDLLILGLILILLFESDCDYALIIVLGLMFFNINLGSLNLSNLF